jgi:hypothetical protein
MKSIIALQTSLGRWNHWLRFRRSVRWGWHGINLGMLIGIANSITGIVQSRLLFADFFSRTALITGVSMVLSIFLGYIWPYSMLKSAIYIDRRFKLQDRISTALELLTADPLHLNPLTVLQRSDALKFIQTLNPRKGTLANIHWMQPLLTILVLILIVGGSTLAKPNFQRSAIRAADKQAIQGEVDRLDKLLSQIIEDQAISEETRTQLTAPIRTALAALEETDNIALAVAAVGQAVGDLRSFEDLGAQADQLEKLGDRLDGTDQPLQPFVTHLASGDLEAAAEFLESLSAQTGENEPSDIVANLEQFSAEARQLFPELAELLDEAAQALKQSDTAAAQARLNDSAEMIQAAAGAETLSPRSTDIAEEISASQERLRAAASSPGAIGAVGQTAIENGPSQEGQGVRAGLGPGSGQGSEEAANEEILGSIPGSFDRQIRPGDDERAAFEQIYAPTRLNGNTGPLIALPDSTIPGNQLPGASPGPVPEAELSQVPYISVFAEYEAIYQQAIDSGQVPPHLREIVRRYFSSLEPD